MLRTQGMGRHRKMKVYVTSIGFHEVIVACASRKRALEAWESKRDLFARGKAYETNDREAREAALTWPETPMARPLGSHKHYKLVIAPGEPPRH